MIEIVCYAGGTCGDLITAMIDSTNATLDKTAIKHDKARTMLKKPHMFNNDQEKNEYIISMAMTYQSIPSHDLDYHVRYGHQFVAVAVKDFPTALWAAERFKSLHKATIWQEMQRVCGATNTKEYAQMLIDYSNMIIEHTRQIVQLERILSGHAALDLSTLLGKELSSDLYNQWLIQQ